MLIFVRDEGWFGGIVLICSRWCTCVKFYSRNHDLNLDLSVYLGCEEETCKYCHFRSNKTTIRIRASTHLQFLRVLTQPNTSRQCSVSTTLAMVARKTRFIMSYLLTIEAVSITAWRPCFCLQSPQGIVMYSLNICWLIAVPWNICLYQSANGCMCVWLYFAQLETEIYVFISAFMQPI